MEAHGKGCTFPSALALLDQRVGRVPGSISVRVHDEVFFLTSSLVCVKGTAATQAWTTPTRQLKVGRCWMT